MTKTFQIIDKEAIFPFIMRRRTEFNITFLFVYYKILMHRLFLSFNLLSVRKQTKENKFTCVLINYDWNGIVSCCTVQIATVTVQHNYGICILLPFLHKLCISSEEHFPRITVSFKFYVGTFHLSSSLSSLFRTEL